MGDGQGQIKVFCLKWKQKKKSWEFLENIFQKPVLTIFNDVK